MEQVRPERPQQPPFIMEGRTLENTFTELEREGKACLYELLKAAVGKMPRTFFSPDRRRWNGALHNEQRDLLTRFLCDGGTAVYGSTFQRAKAKWDAEVRTAPPRQLTEEERRSVIDVPEEQGGGTIYIGAAPERGTTVPLENLFTYWIEEFAAEVEQAVEAFGENPNTFAELQRITNALRSFEVGTSGKLILQPMQADAAGKDQLAKFEYAKDRLVSRLTVIAGSIAVATNGTTATQGPTERLIWTSTTSAFAHIFTTLSNAGYFPIPRRGGKENEPNFTGLARVLLQAFDVKGEDGKSLNVEQLRVRLRPSAPRPLPETKTVKFQIPDKGILIVPNADEMK